MDVSQELERCNSISDIFVLVKKVALEHIGTDQAGLMVRLADLGQYAQGFIGAFYSLDANSIIINKRPLNKMRRAALYKPYVFFILLHEYIHSLGSYDEDQTRILTLMISKECFGEQHPVTQFAVDMSKFFPPQYDEPPSDVNIDFLPGIDRTNTNYIN